MPIYNSGNELENIYFKGSEIKEIYSAGENIYNKKHFTLTAGTATHFDGFVNGFRDGGSDPVLGNFGSLTPNTLSGTTIVQIYTTAVSSDPADVNLIIEPILTFKSIKIIQQDNGFVLGDFEYNSFTSGGGLMSHIIDRNTQQFVNGKEYLIIFKLN